MRSRMVLRLMPSFMVSLISTVAATSPALADDSSAAPASTSQGVAVSVERPSTPAQALLTDPYAVSLGVFLVNTNITAELNGRTSSGSSVDQKLDTGGDYTRYRADLLWRINPKHHVRFFYFRAQQSNTRTLDKPFDWGDYHFQANASLTAEPRLNVYELNYEYTFMRRPDYEISASAGVHYMDMRFKFSGQATVTDANGVNSSASFQTTESNLPAPFPVIGLRAGWAVSPHWVLDAGVQVLKFHYDGYDGRWSDLRLGATWMFHRHFGVGVAYNRFWVNVDIDRDKFNGSLALGYTGPQAFVTGTF